MRDILLAFGWVLGGIFVLVVLGAIIGGVGSSVIEKASEDDDQASNKFARIILGVVIVAILFIVLRACSSNYHPTPSDIRRLEYLP